MKPYQDSKINNNEKIRTFTQEIDSGELMWHRDRKDRIVEIIESDGWKLQLDNELPIDMTVGKKYFIPEGIYHRTIKGNGNLVIKIIEN
jgi:hypothetical protein